MTGRSLFPFRRAGIYSALLAASFLLPVSSAGAQDAAASAAPVPVSPLAGVPDSPAGEGGVPAASDPMAPAPGAPVPAASSGMTMGEAPGAERFPSAADPSAQPIPEVVDDPTQDQWMRMSIEEAFRRMERVSKPRVNPSTLDSLFFTTWQYELLKEAKRGFLSRPATMGEMAVDPSKVEQRERGPREISLGGIVYLGAKNWTIWMNGQRVTPDALPKQVIDIQVEKQFVQLKWFDSYNNLIYPVRLRPHQRFNLDSRIFLPGAGTENL